MESNTPLSALGRSWQLQGCWRDVQEEEEEWRVPISTTCLEKRNPSHWLLSALLLWFWFYLFFLCWEWVSPKDRAGVGSFIPAPCLFSGLLPHTSAGKRRLFSGNDCIYYARLRKWWNNSMRNVLEWVFKCEHNECSQCSTESWGTWELWFDFYFFKKKALTLPPPGYYFQINYSHYINCVSACSIFPPFQWVRLEQGC